MTHSEIAAIVARQLVAESRYLGALAAKPGIRAKHRLILEEAERDLARAAAKILDEGRAKDLQESSGTPDGGAGLPDGG